MDFDGVIVDSMNIKGQGFARVYAGEDSAKVAEVLEYQRHHGGVSRGPKFVHFERNVFGREGDVETIDRLTSTYHRIVFDAVIACPFVPGAELFLQRAAGQIELHVISGTPHDELLEIVERRSLTPFFRSITGGPTSKRDAFARILAENHHSAAHTGAIGDAMTEYVAAKELGMPFIGVVPSGMQSPFPSATPIVPTLESLHDVLGLA